MKNPLLDGGEILGKAEAVLISVLGGPALTVADVQRAVEPISRLASRAQVIMGAAIDPAYRERFSITVLASAHVVPRRVPQNVPGRAARPSPARPLPPSPAKPASQPKQESLPLESATRGRFEKSEPTLYDGEN